MTPLADPSPVEEPIHVPVCRHHADLVGKVESIGADLERIDGKLDLVLEKLLPVPADQTITGKLIGLAKPVVDDSLSRRLLCATILIAVLAGGGIAVSGDLLRGLLLGASAADDARVPSTMSTTGEDGGASLDSTPLEDDVAH